MAYQYKKLITGIEPVSLAEARSYLRIDFEIDDDFLTSLIQKARENIEIICNRSLVEQTIELTATDMDMPFVLPFPPQTEILEVKKNGVDATYTKKGTFNFTITLNEELEDTDELYIKYKTGADVPAGLKPVMLQIIADNYENKNMDISVTYKNLGLLNIYKNY